MPRPTGTSSQPLTFPNAVRDASAGALEARPPRVMILRKPARRKV
jgi:hypothetical protein